MICPRRALSIILNTAKRLDVKAVIAGGAAAHFGLADDIDVFVLNNDEEGAARLLDTLERESYARSQVIEAIPEWWTPLTLDCFSSVTYGEEGDPVFKMASFNMWLAPGQLVNQPGQLIIRVEPDVESLLMGFDMSCHMWAITAPTTRIGCARSTSVEEPFWCHHWHPSWAKRARKFAARYDISLANEAEMLAKDKAAANEGDALEEEGSDHV